MAMVDPFTPSAFTLTSLTAAINQLKYQPARLSGLYEEQGISTLTASVEERDGVLNLVEIKPRGAKRSRSARASASPRRRRSRGATG